jgi:hypothetical protein
MSKIDGKKRANSILSQRVIDGNREYTVYGIGTLTLYPDKVSAVCRAYAMGHGFDQRVRDAAALSANRDTGKSATPQEKFDAMKRIVDHLNSGTDDWHIKVAAAPKGPDAGTIILAMVRALHKTVDEVEALLAATMAKRGVDRNGALKVWEDSKQVAAMILVIKTERLARDTDSDDLVAEMEAAMDSDDGDGDDETDEEAPF